MTRILVVGQSYGRGHAATSDLFTDLAEGLLKEGCAVEVLTAAADGAPASVGITNGVLIHFVSRSGSRLLQSCPGIGRGLSLASLWLNIVGWCLLTRRRYSHVIVLDTPHLVTLAGLILKARHGSAVIAWVMDRPLLQIQRLNPTGSIKSTLGGWLNRCQTWFFERCDRVVPLGACMEATLRQEGIDPKRIVMIRSWDCDDLPSHAISSAEARERAQLPQRFTVMYSGYAGAWHDFETVLASVQALAYEPQLQFLFVGEGPGIERVRAWCSSNLDTHVIFRSYVPAEQRIKSLCCGDLHLVCLKPSMVGTCVPSKLNAILGLGRPVLVVAPPECQASLDAENSGAGACTPSAAELTAAITSFSQKCTREDDLAVKAVRAYQSHHTRHSAISQWQRLVSSI